MLIESFADAIKWRRVHRHKLKRASKEQRLATRPMRKCRRKHRCGTEACRVCMRDFCVSWAGEAIKVLLQRSGWTRCSIITKGLMVPRGGLDKFDLKREVKRIRKRLERSGIGDRVVLGALDLSLNVENNVVAGWQFHAYLIVEGEDDRALRKIIKRAFPPEPTASAPYGFAEVSDPLQALTYAYKSVIMCRSGYTNQKGKHGTADQPLKRADLCELLAFLGKYKVGARLILCGVRRNGQRLMFTRSDRPSTRRRS
jgi:hypothetical protein